MKGTSPRRNRETCMIRKGSVYNMSKQLTAVALALILMMVLAGPAFAQSLNMTTTYDMEGTINLQKQAGHKCNTGAEVKQTIVGNGTMQKAQTINMIEGRIMMEDENDWVAGASPLTVTTVWELCAPPKYVYDTEDEIAVPLSVLYNDDENELDWSGYESLTGQIWAVQVQADPGFSGNLYQNAVAAHGPFNADISGEASDYEWADEGHSSYWGFLDNRYGNPVPTVGPDYVGSYFDIEQQARTSQGTLRRYIDISSPFNHGYLMEDMSVVGRSDVQETFSMQNLPAGSDIVGDWWNLF